MKMIKFQMEKIVLLTQPFLKRLVFFSLLFSTTQCYAATYYFSTSGNNTTGNGSQAAPFYSLCGPWAGSGCKTGESKISMGQIPVVAGDQLLFKRGDEWVGLDAMWNINATGAANNPITFGAWGDPNAARPVFRGALTAHEMGIDAWINVVGTPIWYTNGVNSWPNMAAMEETAPGGPQLYGAWSVQGVNNSNGWDQNQSMVKGTYYYDGTLKRLYVWRTDELKPDHAAGRDIYIGYGPRDGSDRLIKVNRGWANGSTDPKFKGSNYIFKDLHAKMSSGYGISAQYPNTQVINCISELNAMEGILFSAGRFTEPLPGAKDGLIKDCIVRRNNLKQGSGAGQGITIESENVWVRDSEVYENAWAGIDFLDFTANTKPENGGVVNCKVHHNGIQPVSAHNFDANIYVDGGSNILIQDSQIWGAGVDPRGVKTRKRANPGISIDVEGPGFYYGSRPNNIKVVNCLIYGNMGTQIQIGDLNGSQSAVSCFSNIQIIGCTLLRDRSDNELKSFYSASVVDTFQRVVKAFNVTSGFGFKNNIVMASNTSMAPMMYYEGWKTVGKTVADFNNNIYYSAGTNFNVNSAGLVSFVNNTGNVNNYTTDQWLNLGATPDKQRDTAQPKAIVNSNPLLTNLSTANFDAHLMTGSTAINTADPSAFPVPVAGSTSTDGSLDLPYNDTGFHYLPASGAVVPPPDTQAPSVPTGLAVSLSGSQVSMSWTPSTDNVAVAGYKIYDGTALITTVTNSSFSFTGASGRTYNCSVKAFDAANNFSGAGQFQQVTVPVPADTAAPSAPSGLTASLNGTLISLLWNASTDNTAVTGYQIFDSATLLGTVTSTTFSLTGTVGQTYNFTVKAFDAANNISVPGNTATLTVGTTPPPPTDATVPTTPTGLSFSTSGTQVTLTWTASTDDVAVTHYKIMDEGALSGTSSSTSFAKSLLEGTTHAFSVIAVDASGKQSLPSAISLVTIPIAGGPTTPTNFTATYNGSQVQMSWSASTNHYGYNIWRNGIYLKTLPATATSSYDNSVLSGNAYTYNVQSYNASDKRSPMSNSATVTIGGATTTDITAPTVPSNVVLTLSANNDILTTWNVSTDNVGVSLYWVYSNGTQLGSTSSRAFTIANTISAQSYAVTVKACDAAANCSAQSAPVSITLADTTNPSAPFGLSAVLNGAQALLSWQAATDNVGVTAYKVFNDLAEVGTSAATSFTFEPITTGQSYRFTVKALDAANNISIASNEVVLPINDTIPPSAPTQLAASVSGTQAILNWVASTDNVGVTQYQIFRNGALFGTNVAPTLTVTGLISGQTDTFLVKAADANNNVSAASNVVTVTVSNTTTGPAAPKDLIAYTYGNYITISWSSSPNAAGYALYRNNLFLKNVNGLTTTDKTVVGSTTYVYKIQAYDAANNYSGFSNNMSVTMPAGPTAPTNLVGARTSSTKVVLNWTPSTNGLMGYNIYRNGSYYITINTTPSFTDNVTAGTNYTYKIQAYNASNIKSAYSNEVTI